LCSRTRFRRYRGRRVPFTTFALPDAFSAFPRASRPVFKSCAPERVFGFIERVGSCFHVLRSRTCFWRYQGRWVPFTSFALPGSFSAVPSASGPVFTLELLRASGPVSKFTLPDVFSALRSASGLVFKFCTPGRVFCGFELVGPRFNFCAPVRIFGVNEGVGSGFQILRSRTHFRCYRGHQVRFSSFMQPDVFSTVPGASGPVFTFCAIGRVFGDSEHVGSRFHVLRSWTRFRRFRACRVPFSIFPLPGAFSPLPRASDPVLMFCGPGRVFGGSEHVGSRFHVLRFRTRFWSYQGRRVRFFQVLRSRMRF